MYLSFKKGGIPVARIEGGKYHNKKVFLVEDKSKSLNNDNDISDLIDIDEYLKSTGSKKINIDNIKKLLSDDQLKEKNMKELHLHDGRFIPIPQDKNDDRACLYISGPSGAGKSTFVRNYIIEYRKMRPMAPVYLFSRVPDDKAYDDLHYVERIKIDENLIEDPMDIQDEIENESLVIFDDIDTIKDPDIKKEIQHIRNDILETGRHRKIETLCTSHLMTNYGETRTLLNESHGFVFYPKAGGSYQIKRALKIYGGLEDSKKNNQIERVMNLPSRWVMFHKAYPNYVLSENSLYLTN